MKAHQILEAGICHMKDRSATYDKPAGERSMGATVDAFRAITGHDLTEEQGWLFMGLLKMVRSQQGGFRADNYEDLAAYAGLQGEAAWAERTNQEFGQQNTLDCRSAEQKGFNDPRTVEGPDVAFETERHMYFAPEVRCGDCRKVHYSSEPCDHFVVMTGFCDESGWPGRSANPCAKHGVE